MHTGNVSASRVAYSTALKNYKQAVRRTRLEQDTSRDDQLLTILSDNPSSLYSFIKSSRNVSNTLIDKLSVGAKTYTGNQVPDGFFDAMTSLKTYKPTDFENETVADQLDTYQHIMKLSEIKKPIPIITIECAVDLLCRLKKNGKDFYSITALHYIYAGLEGILHFQAMINAIVHNVKNATLEELNVAHGVISYKGHKKDKTSERSYRCISSCPFLSKAVDLYMRDLHHEKWDDCQASTQYQGTALLVTEVVRHAALSARSEATSVPASTRRPVRIRQMPAPNLDMRTIQGWSKR